jgi:hypothetical protein
MINSSPWMTGTGGILLIAFAVFITFAVGYYMRLKMRIRRNEQKWQAEEERKRIQEATILEAMLAELDTYDTWTH